MRLCILSDCSLPTPMANGHGLGRVTHMVAEGLRQRGHDMTLIAKVGSQFSGTLITPKKAEGYEGEKILAKAAYESHLSQSYDAFVDNSHTHWLSGIFPHLPVVNVYHDVFQEYTRNPVLLSSGQRALMPDAFWDARIIPNCFDASGLQFSCTADPQNYALYLGAIAEIKQPMLAIEAAARYGCKLIMAGASAGAYLPFWGETNVTYVGAVSGTYRRDLIAGARVFLQLGMVESFGLTTLEANYSGVPVVAWPAGGNVDTVRYGVNGVFVPTGRDKVKAVCDAIERAWWMDRFTCHQYAVSVNQFAAQLDAYEQACIDVIEGRGW